MLSGVQKRLYASSVSEPNPSAQFVRPFFVWAAVGILSSCVGAAGRPSEGNSAFWLMLLRGVAMGAVGIVVLALMYAKAPTVARIRRDLAVAILMGVLAAGSTVVIYMSRSADLEPVRVALDVLALVWVGLAVAFVVMKGQADAVVSFAVPVAAYAKGYSPKQLVLSVDLHPELSPDFAEADEEEGIVKVRVVASRRRSWVDDGTTVSQQVKVRLDRPLGGRTVIGVDGSEVPEVASVG